MIDPIIVNPEPESYDPDLVNMKDEVVVYQPQHEDIAHMRVYMDNDTVATIDLETGDVTNTTYNPMIT